MFFAYIDPGAGSLVIQALIASALAVPFLLRSHLGRAIQRLKGWRGTAAAQDTTEKR